VPLYHYEIKFQLLDTVSDEPLVLSCDA